KNAWDYTLEVIALMGDIDYANEMLSKTTNIKERKIISDRIDTLEGKFFDLKNKLKSIELL
ncbi:hypothetical protein, partial [Clostridium tarantellae]